MESDAFVLVAMLATPFPMLFFTVGCARLAPVSPDFVAEASADEPDEAGVGGVDGTVLQLPWPMTLARLCTQGAYGTWSHSYPSTLHDLDFDTSNTEDEEVYAPVAGIARVHTESATANFGYHVNIDLGDGTYAVLGHLKDIFVFDGEEVAAGEFIGHEGCTGACTGDHIHLGLHRGDAAQMAEFGESIPASYFAGDDTAAGEGEDIFGDDFICGIASNGDPEDGHWYRSALPVPLAHPNGTLVQVPGDAKVYRLDDGALRWIVDETVFTSYGYRFSDVVLIADEEGNCYEAGSSIDELGLVDAAYDPSGQLWLVVAPEDRPDRYRIEVLHAGWMGVLASWGLSYSEDYPPPTVASDNPYLVDWPIAAGHAPFRDGALVKEATTSDVYVIADGVAMPIKDWDTLLLAGFYGRNIQTVADGQVAEVQGEVGDCANDDRCFDQESVTTCASE